MGVPMPEDGSARPKAIMALCPKTIPIRGGNG